MSIFYGFLDSFLELMVIGGVVVVGLCWYNFYLANKDYSKKYHEAKTEQEREKIKNEWTLYNFISSFFHTRWW